MGSSCAESAFTQYRRNKIHSKQIKTVPSFEIGQIIDSKGHPIRLSLLSYQLENISFSTQVVLIKIEILHDMLLVEGLRIPFSLDVDLEDDAMAQAQDQCPPHQFNRVVLVGITNIGTVVPISSNRFWEAIWNAIRGSVCWARLSAVSCHFPTVILTHRHEKNVLTSMLPLRAGSQREPFRRLTIAVGMENGKFTVLQQWPVVFYGLATKSNFTIKEHITQHELPQICIVCLFPICFFLWLDHRTTKKIPKISFHGMSCFGVLNATGFHSDRKGLYQSRKP